MQLFSMDATIFKKNPTYYNMKKTPSNVAHTRPNFFQYCQPAPTSSNLNFCSTIFPRRVTYV